ncbi:hypothetical protein [Streptomyces sp. NPDC058620]|uniref:hypothetical protein n=1 Tax=Streptomyces sp. NPDC058620 TaxID=3346560 RepID=UPI00364AFE8D
MSYSERPVAQARRAKAAELIERLVAERRVVIQEPDEATEAEYRRAIDCAKRHKLTPPGKRIEKLRLWNRDLQISLEDGPHHNAKSERPESAPPIPVPPNCGPFTQWWLLSRKTDADSPCLRICGAGLSDCSRACARKR